MSGASSWSGSSPLSRGIRHHQGRSGRQAGIIPALAGNTPGCVHVRAATGDHPRSRGEYYGLGFSTRSPEGSSPLSRGIHGEASAASGDSRIIPALAGNTSRTRGAPRPARDHPRSRGEYVNGVVHEFRDEGSSPLSRGIHAFLDPLLDLVRIIPALAGNTYGRAPRGQRWRDHPRSRGEYSAAVTGAIGSSGSSPLSRGIRVCDDSSFPAGGIIPALAGNTTGWRELTATDRDHPRSRGEYEEGGEVTGGESGSSPLSRGIP